MSRHEESDVNVGAVFGFGAGLAALTAVVFVVVWLVFVFLDRRERSIEAPAYPLAEGQGLRLPPEPRLQTAPRTDLREFRSREDALLDSYQWVDKASGVVRIPVSEAMKLVVQRGLPSREASK
jgi:hypothetical protein